MRKLLYLIVVVSIAAIRAAACDPSNCSGDPYCLAHCTGDDPTPSPQTSPDTSPDTSPGTHPSSSPPDPTPPLGANESPPAVPVGTQGQPGTTPGLGTYIDPATGAVVNPSSALTGGTTGNTNVVTNQTTVAQTNSSKSSDPIRLAWGDLSTSDTDLSLIVDGIPLAVSRANLGDKTYTPSLSKYWSLNLDSRVIWGVKPLANQIVDDLRAQRQTLWDSYYNANQAYLSYISDLDAKISAIEDAPDGILPTYQSYLAQRIALRDNESPGSSRWNYYNNYVVIAQNVVNEYTTALTNLNNARSTFINTYNWQISGLYFDWQQKDGDVVQAEKELALSSANDSRTRHTWDSSQPSAWKLVGTGKIVILDDQGTPWVMNIQESPQYSSTSHYANGDVNYYPVGSELTGTKTGEHAWLDADGSVHWKHRDRLEWVYDYYGQLSRIQDRWGNYYSFVYNPSTHVLSSVQDKRGRTILSFARDSQSRIVSVTDIGGRSASYSYDTQGRLSSVTDSSGDTVSYTYTPENLLSRIVKPDGTYRENHYGTKDGRFVVDWQHDEDGNLELFSYQTDYTDYVTPQGVTERHYFNNRFLESRVEYPDGRWIAYSYNGSDLMTRALYSNGEDIVYDYDTDGNLVYRKNLDETVERWEYDDDHNLTKYTDPRYNQTVVAISNGLPASIYRPGQPAENFSYYSDAKVMTHQYPNGLVLSYGYDANGYLSGISGGSGSDIRNQNFTNDVLGHVLSATDASGVTLRYSYYPTDKIKRIFYPDGRLKYYVYDNRKDLVHEELRCYPGLTGDQVAALSEAQLADTSRYQLLDWTDYNYDHRHLLLSVTNSLGEKVLYDYATSSVGTASTLVSDRKIEDASGQTIRTTNYSYDSSARVTSVTDTGLSISQPVTRNYRYDSSGRLAYAQDARGVWTQYTYTTGSRIAAEDIMIGGSSPESGIYAQKSKASYSDGLISESADVRDIRTRYSYDSLNRVQSVQGLVSGLWQQLQAYDYDVSGQVAKVTDGRGFVTTMGYDAWGENTSVQDPLAASDGRSSSGLATYNNRGLLDTKTDALGLVTAYTYDNISRITAIATKKQGGSVLTNRTVSYSYQNGLAVVTDTDERGTTRTRTFDRLGRVTKETNGYGKSKLYHYNVYGKIDRYQDEMGLVVTIEYDGIGRVTAQRRAGVLIGQWSYDGNGNVLSHTDGEGRTTAYNYDNFGRLIRERQGVNGSTQAMNITYAYSADNRHVTKTVGTFSQTYNYDDLGRVASETDGLGSTQSYSYDLNGNLTSKTDFKGQNFSFSYDPNNRLSAIQQGTQEQRRYTYDARGSILSVTNPGTNIGFSYDILGRMTSQINADGTSFSYGYDAGGLRLYRQQGTSGPKVQYSYGAEGEISRIVDETGLSVDFVYDDALRQIGETRSNGTKLTRGFDDSGRLSYIKEQEGTGRYNSRTTWAEGYVYNKADQVKLSVDEDGLVTAYNYDDAGRLVKAQYPSSSGKQSADRNEMDSLGLRAQNPSRRDNNLVTDTGDHAIGDALYANISDSRSSHVSWNQSVWAEQFSYDSAGNRAGVTNPYGTINYQYDQANRLVKAGNRNYQYDANGNLTREQYGNETENYSYSWDNRVTGYTTTGTSHGQSDDVSIAYTYDGLGRRASRVANEHSKTTVQKYSYEGGSLTFAAVTTDTVNGGWGWQHDFGNDNDGWNRWLGDIWRGWGLSFHHDETERFANAGSRVVTVNDTRDSSVYTTDRLGSVRRVTDERAHEEAGYNYDAFGVSIGKDDPEFLGYTGKPIDPQTGSYDYGFRDYAPETARFTTVDPVQDGNNWYAYVGNDPINRLDLSGLSTSDETTVGTSVSKLSALGSGPSYSGGSSVGGVVTVTPGAWNPGNQPAELYIGNAIHDNIAAAYAEAHTGQLVVANHTPINSIIAMQGGNGGVQGGELKPDIYNTATNELYEIKPANNLVGAIAKATTEVSILWNNNVPAVLGSSSDSGSYGVVSAPGGYATYYSPAPGAIIYEYHSSRSTEPIQVAVPFPSSASAENNSQLLKTVGTAAAVGVGTVIVGKVVGAVVGFVTGGPIGAVAGAVVAF